jgi:hypothetical protein
MGLPRHFFLPALVAGCLLACTCASAKGSEPATDVWPHWPYPTSCGIGTPFNPVSTFRAAAGAETGESPSELALGAILADPQLSWLGFPKSGWRLVSEDAELAVFVAGLPSADDPFPLQFLTVAQKEDQWKLNSSGTCQLRSVLPAGQVVTWDLAREQPGLHPDTRYVRINLGAGSCDSGASQNDRARKPTFRQIGRNLLMTMSLEPLPPGVYTCIGIIAPPMTVRLPGRLGTRTLLDGASYPPRSAAETRPPSSRLVQ